MPKITGIQEHEGENTDKAVLNVINGIILKYAQVQLSMSNIERSHRVGLQRGKTIGISLLNSKAIAIDT